MISKNHSFAKVATLVSVVLLSATLTGCNNANSEMINPVVTPVKLLSVPELSDRQLDSFLAKVDATERAQLSFQVGGEVASATVRMGQKVRQGQVIARLDPTDYQLAVDAKQAHYELVSTQYKRAKQLFNKKLISADSYDQIETSLKASLANLEQAKTDLSHTQLLAPFDGIVSYNYAKQYQLVAAKQPVVNLINIDQMDVSFSLPVSYVEQVGIEALKQKNIWITMDNHSEQLIAARFKQLSTQPDLDTNSYSATVIIERPQNMNLLTGMTGQVHVQSLSSQVSFSLPQAAWLTKQEGLGQLWKFDPTSQQVSKVEVMLDAEQGVVSGLSQGDLVVVAGVDSLVEGQVVKAWQREGGI